MCANEVVKRNISGMQVIKTLQLLLEGNFAMSELIKRLNENEENPVFNNSVVSKYINTCRYCGVNIHKIHNKYFVAKLPFGLELSSRDFELLNILQNKANQQLSGKSIKLFNNFITRLNQYSNKDIIRVEKKTLKITCEKFDKAIQDNRKVLLMFKAKALLECIPLAIVEKKGNLCFKVLIDDKERYVSLDRITGLQILGKIFVPSDEELGETVVFKIKGDLVSRYNMREHEQEISRNFQNEIIISNVGEDKKDLLARLLRYDNCCEILRPQSYRDEFKSILNNMLANYGEL